jgi:truncated hemoglobin YjbI
VRLSLFDELGGDEVVGPLVAAFHARMLGDSEIGHLFPDELTPDLLARQQRYFTALLGGPASHEAEALELAHRTVPIEDRHVTAALAHLEAALADAGVKEDLARRVVAVAARIWWARNW